MKKIIIIADWIINYIAYEHYYFAKCLEDLNWKMIKLSEFKPDLLNATNNKIIIFFFTYDSYDFSYLKNNENIKILYKLDDLYPNKNIRINCINNSDLVFGPYQYLYNKVYPILNNKKTLKIPYSAVNLFFEDIKFNENPIRKIFTSGAMNKKIYPFRYFIQNNNNLIKHIDILKHPGYKKKKSHNYIHKNYYKILNKYICGFVDASKYKYVLLKVYEICSVGSLLLICDSIKNELNELGFFHNINCIMCNKNNIQEKVEWILDIINNDKIINIRKNGMELVREKHTTKKRALLFDNNIKKIYFN